MLFFLFWPFTKKRIYAISCTKKSQAVQLNSAAWYPLSVAFSAASRLKNALEAAVVMFPVVLAFAPPTCYMYDLSTDTQ